MTVRCSLGHENPEGAAFCDECGEPLASAVPTADNTAAPAVGSAPTIQQEGEACPTCGTINPPGEAFCSSCGADLLGAPAAVAAPSAAPVAAAPEPVAAAPTAAPSNLNARLVVEADNQEFDLSGKDNILIGREDAVSNIFPDVDLTPNGGEEGGVSRMHARIFADNGQYMIEDENSTNFTFVNRQRLAPKTPTPLHDNDEIKLGRVLLRFKTS